MKLFLSFCLMSSVAFALKPITIIDMKVTEKGFEPSEIRVSEKTHVQLNVTREVKDTCATTIQIPAKKMKFELPLNKTVKIDLGELKKGEIKFGCGMNMMEGGKIFVE